MGKVDFVAMVKRVAESMDNAIMRIIVKQIETAYVGQPNGLYHFQGSYDDGKLMELIANVEARTGQKVAIYGNALALANLRKSSAALWSEAEKEEVRNAGHVGKFNGFDVVEIANFMDNHDNLVLNQNILFLNVKLFLTKKFFYANCYFLKFKPRILPKIENTIKNNIKMFRKF